MILEQNDYLQELENFLNCQEQCFLENSLCDIYTDYKVIKLTQEPFVNNDNTRSVVILVLLHMFDKLNMFVSFSIKDLIFLFALKVKFELRIIYLLKEMQTQSQIKIY